MLYYYSECYVITYNTYRYLAWGYGMHMMNEYFSILSFFSVMLYWSSTLEFGGKLERIKWIVGFVAFGLGFMNLSSFIYMSKYGFMNSNYPLAVLALSNAIALLSGALWMLIYGVRLQKRLANHQKVVKEIDFSKRALELLRINIVLVVCVACFALRSVALIYVFLWDFKEVADDGSQYPLFGWFIITLWIPELFPVSTLYILYIYVNVVSNKWIMLMYITL